MRLRGKEYLEAALALSLLLSLFLWFFVHGFLREMEGESAAEAMKDRKIVIAVQNYQNAHLDREAFMKEIVEAQQRADKAMPDEMEQGAFLSRLQQEAIGAGLKLRQVKPGEVDMEGDCRVLPVEVQMAGNYFQLLSFLRDLDKEERFMQLRDLKVHSEQGHLQCDMKICIFAEPAKA